MASGWRVDRARHIALQDRPLARPRLCIRDRHRGEQRLCQEGGEVKAVGAIPGVPARLVEEVGQRGAEGVGTRLGESNL